MLSLAYFTHRDVRIPNIDKRWESIMQFFEEKEKDCLISVLGAKLYESYKLQLDQHGKLNTDAPQIWRSLVEGETYDDKVWQGFADVEDKRSFLAYYAYHKWAIDSEANTFSTGEQIEEVENSKTVSNERKRIIAYNNFVSWVAGYYQDGRVSLYEYLTDKKDDFPDWKGTDLCYINVWNV